MLIRYKGSPIYLSLSNNVFPFNKDVSWLMIHSYCSRKLYRIILLLLIHLQIVFYIFRFKLWFRNCCTTRLFLHNTTLPEKMKTKPMGCDKYAVTSWFFISIFERYIYFFISHFYFPFFIFNYHFYLLLFY